MTQTMRKLEIVAFYLSTFKKKNLFVSSNYFCLSIQPHSLAFKLPVYKFESLMLRGGIHSFLLSLRYHLECLVSDWRPFAIEMGRLSFCYLKIGDLSTLFI